MGRGLSDNTKALRDGIMSVANELALNVSKFTVRQLFYRCTVEGVIEKTEKGYKKICSTTVEMRKEGLLDDNLFVDSSRSVYAPSSWNSPEEALESLANQYAESPWKRLDVEVEVWVEKEALAELVKDACEPYFVTVRVMKGYPSRTAMYRAHRAMVARGRKSTIVYQLCDFDASGQGAGFNAYKVIDDFYEADPNSVHGYEFIELGVTLDQIREWRLPTRPAKESDPRQASFGHDFAVELDAIDPPVFQQLIRDAIEKYLPQQVLDVHNAEVESVRDYLRGLGNIKGADKTMGSFFDIFTP